MLKRKTHKQKFWLAYLLVTVLSLATLYAVVESKADIPLVLSDAQMQKLVGSTTTKKDCRVQSNGCYPDDTGCDGDIKKYFHWGIFKYCHYTGNESDNCLEQQIGYVDICLIYTYNNAPCSGFNNSVMRETNEWCQNF